MGTIEDIIKTIDNELINRGKEYLLLGQANQLLLDQNIISTSDKFENHLKRLLEAGNIPHAYQTENKPKQWRIPLSKEGKQKVLAGENKKNTNKKNKFIGLSTICPDCGTYSKFGTHCKCGRYIVLPNELIPKQSEIKPTYVNIENQINQTICPSCGITLFVPNEIAHDLYINCQNCKRDIPNPLQNKNGFNNSKNLIISDIEKQKNDFLKYSLFASIGIGFFFPPVWIGSVILTFFIIFRKR